MITAAIPAYCTPGHIRTPSQWETCWKIGWNEPTTGAAHAGYAAGHSAAPALVAALILLAIFWMVRKSRTSEA